MSHYVVIYLKVSHSKEGGLEFEGPILGPSSKTEDGANAEAKKIVSSMPRFAVMPKIYQLTDRQTPDEALDIAKKHFEVLKDNIIESKEIMDKPIKRSKKKQ